MKLNQLISTTLSLTYLTTAQAGLKAHEWGTFTSLVGSNGITVNGMYHEDEELPGFVHGFGETRSRIPDDPVSTPTHRPCHGKSCFLQDFYDQNSITQKMETPVIYFYVDKETDIDVNVKFPEGLLTETYPAPVFAFPQRSDMPTLGNGELTFKGTVLPVLDADIPYVDPTNIYSHARNVASNIFQINSEREKFIFYRGLGKFQPRISITSKNGDLIIGAPRAQDTPGATFLIDVNQAGHGQLKELSIGKGTTVNAELIKRLQNHNGTPSKSIVSGAEAKERLVSGLMDAGLFEDEATAMVDTWEHGYLKTPGLRLLYILPRNEVDQILPLKITPQPEALERAFVGRIEIMLDTEEKSILADVLTLKDSFSVVSLGRFAESKLRRVLDVYQERESAAHRIPDTKILNVFENLINRAKNPS